MLLNNHTDLRAAVMPGRRVMGLDVGTKTVGLALSDTRLVIASPLDTIRRRRFREDIAALFALVDRHDVGGLVIGLPLSLGGGDSPRQWCGGAQATAGNARHARSRDERLSTAAVTREMTPMT